MSLRLREQMGIGVETRSGGSLGLFVEDTMATVTRVKKAGYQPSWEKCGWNAEIYLAEEEQNPPKACDTPWRWLVPVKKA